LDEHNGEEVVLRLEEESWTLDSVVRVLEEQAFVLLPRILGVADRVGRELVNVGELISIYNAIRQ
jgi:hypothetical protein